MYKRLFTAQKLEMAYSDKHGFNKIRIYSLKELYKYLRNLRLKMLIDALSFIDSGSLFQIVTAR